jgi:hypothetical protein
MAFDIYNYLILFIIWDISDEYSSVPSDELVDYAHFCAGQLQHLQLPACSHPKDLGENGHTHSHLTHVLELQPLAGIAN